MDFRYFRAGAGQSPVATFLNITFGGKVDRGQIEKIAADESLRDFGITPKKGHQYLHIVTLGAGEFYGANTWGDYFNEGPRKVSFPYAEHKTAGEKTLRGGLRERHGTFMKYGHLYRNHKNGKQGYKALGNIVWEHYNPDMHRGEVVGEFPEDEWADELQKAASGETLPFSMGCGIDYDICSACGHESPTRKQYCDHLKYRMLDFDKDGLQFTAITDRPTFHDLSYVRVPADRTALGLAKVASGMSASEAEEELRISSPALYLPASFVGEIATEKEKSRIRTLQKLASMEKEVAAVSEDGLLPSGQGMAKDQINEIVTRLRGSDEKELLSALKDAKLMLPPEAFCRLVLEVKDVDGAALGDHLDSVFNKLYSNTDCAEIAADDAYASDSCAGPAVKSKVDAVSGLLSLDPEAVQKRSLTVIVAAPEQRKTAQDDSERYRLLAKEYARYQLSLLDGMRDQELRTAVVLNRM